MRKLTNNTNNNIVTIIEQKDGRFACYFGYVSEGKEYTDSVKTFATEKTAISKANKYLGNA